MENEQTSRRMAVMLALVAAVLVFSAGCMGTPGTTPSTSTATPAPPAVTTPTPLERTSAASGTDVTVSGTVPPVPSTESGSTGTTETVAEVPSSAPSIRITSVSDGFVTGHAEGVDASDTRVTLYIRVRGAWWGPKPYWDEPYTTINADGSWRTPYITGGVDNEASEVAAYLVPVSYNPPDLDGDESLPEELSRFPGIIRPI